MKNMTRTLTVLAALSIVSAHAGIVTGTSIIDGVGGDVVITDNSGNAIPVATGYVGLGYFTIDDATVTAGATASGISTILNSFQSIVSGAFEDEGLYLKSFDYGKGGLDSQNGKTLYSVIGNGSTIGSSNQFVLYKHDDTLDADGASPSIDENQLNLNDGSLLFGTSGGAKTVDASNLLTNDNYTAASSFAMALVPEPSSTALLGLGGVALLLRRRR